MRQDSVVEDLQAVHSIMQSDPDKARTILGRIIHELQHETVVTPEYKDLLGEYEKLQKRQKQKEHRP
jgi:LmbE family N-acetylglucosaminyl deacetylase